MAITQLDDIIRSLVKTVKAIQMYGLHHPSAKNFYVPFHQKLSSYLRNYGELSCQIEQFSFLHAGTTVYEEKEKDVSIAFRLFRDGIRNVTFSEGLTFDELLLFLEIISQVSKEQDMALNLWECDFNHIEFYVVEEEDHTIGYQVPEIPVREIDYDAKIHEIINKEKIDLSEIIALSLNSDELSKLKTETENVIKFPFIQSAITTLINLLEIEQSRLIINSLTELLEQCIDNNDFYDARRIVHRLNQYTDVNPIEKFENPTVIMGFKNIINTTPDRTFNEFVAFLGFFSKKSVPHFVKLLSHVKHQKRIAALRSRIAYIVQDDPSPITAFLNDPDVKTVVNAIAIIGLMKLQKAPTLLRPLLNHPSPFVRIEIISVFEKVGKPSMIAKFIDDEGSQVRIKALQTITRIRYPRIYPELLRRIKNRAFYDLEFVEQKEFFNCLVANGGREVTKELKKMLYKWFLFGRKRYIITRKLAAMALANVASEEALKILQKGFKKRNKDIKAACQMALKQT